MMVIRTGIGFDAHRLVDGRRLVLGGVTIEHDTGLEGHSDADVLTHAIIDAMLGAAADGDIGTHFPDTDERWHGANSLELLRIVVERIRSKSMDPVNIDATIMAQRPRLAPYIEQMRRGIASSAGMRTEDVSVKATTTEGMGAFGRGEGIGAMAVATLRAGVADG